MSVTINRFSHCMLAMIMLKLCMLPSFAQMEASFSVGDTAKIELKSGAGNSIVWKVLTNTEELKGVEANVVTCLTPEGNPFIKVRWEKGGLFFLSVTVFNQEGCSNRKLFPVFVLDNHFPVANDDYASTEWLKSITVNLLGNDRDSKNDLDPASLQLLSKAEYGEVTNGPAGTITYVPRLNLTGIERFLYTICDSCSQCDTAAVSIALHETAIYLPEGISPNGDGLNDQFVIKGLEAYPKSSLTIFGRDGTVIYRNEDYQNDWRGVPNIRKNNTLQVPSGTYYYLLHLGGTNRRIKGFIFIAE